MRRFADLHGSPAAVVLVSGDVNFSSDLNDIRHRYFLIYNTCLVWNINVFTNFIFSEKKCMLYYYIMNCVLKVLFCVLMNITTTHI